MIDGGQPSSREAVLLLDRWSWAYFKIAVWGSHGNKLISGIHPSVSSASVPALRFLLCLPSMDYAPGYISQINSFLPTLLLAMFYHSNRNPLKAWRSAASGNLNLWSKAFTRVNTDCVTLSHTTGFSYSLFSHYYFLTVPRWKVGSLKIQTIVLYLEKDLIQTQFQL